MNTKEKGHRKYRKNQKVTPTYGNYKSKIKTSLDRINSRLEIGRKKKKEKKR